VLTFFAILITTKIVGIYEATVLATFIFTLFLTIVNSTILPIIKILTWPLDFLTFGGFYTILNLLVLWIISLLVPNFAFSGFWQIIIFTITLGVVEWFIFKLEI